jgi:hypothetical protein
MKAHQPMAIGASHAVGTAGEPALGVTQERVSFDAIVR